MTTIEYIIGALMLAVILGPLALEWYRRQPKQEASPRDLEIWGDWPNAQDLDDARRDRSGP